MGGRAPPRRTGGPAERYAAMKTTIDQPIPISSRLAPVMLASASEQASARSAGRMAGPRTARTRAAFPREDHVDGVLGQDRDEREDGDRQPAEMSSRATSAAHDRMKAAPTIASPYSRASTQFASDTLENRSTIAGTVMPIARRSDVSEPPEGRRRRDERRSAIRDRSPRPLLSGRRSRPREARDPPGRDARPS